MNKENGTVAADSRHRPLAQVAVALDTDDYAQFQAWCGLFGPRVGVLKVGLEAFVRWGAVAVERAGRHDAKVFLDLKLHDIPATVAAATGSAVELGVSWLTVHASGGRAMLTAAGDAAAGRTRLLAVTVLTSLDQAEIEALGWRGSVADRASEWAAIAAASGCAGAVTSPHEAARLRTERGADFFLVTPGVRPDGISQSDQRRVMTPRAALDAGSDLLVIGRPLTRAPDPGRALDDLERELGR